MRDATWVDSVLQEKSRMPSICVKFAKLHPEAVIPKYAKEGDAGLDLTAISMQKVDNESGTFHEYKTGLAVEIPEGYVGLLFPRSSNSKMDLLLSNSVGVIDSGYRGDIGFRFKETADSPRKYSVGDRVGQLLILPYPKVYTQEVSYDQLTQTERGTGGYGSSGR